MPLLNELLGSRLEPAQARPRFARGPIRPPIHRNISSFWIPGWWPEQVQGPFLAYRVGQVKTLYLAAPPSPSPSLPSRRRRLASSPRRRQPCVRSPSSPARFLTEAQAALRSLPSVLAGSHTQRDRGAPAPPAGSSNQFGASKHGASLLD